jgi:hypothetical protein
MKNRFQSFSFLLTLGVALGLMTWGGTLLAQDAPAQTPQSAPEQSAPAAQPSQQPAPEQTPSQTPDQQTAPSQTTPSQTAPSPEQPSAPQSQTDASGGQTFTGTVVKQGDKYVLQDAASGTIYDIDHQDEVKKFDGKKVRVHGTLDASGKMIHVQ